MPTVTAAPGFRVPLEHPLRGYIEAVPVEVPDTQYYRRRLATGELVLAAAATPVVPASLPAMAPTDDTAAGDDTPTTRSRK